MSTIPNSEISIPITRPKGLSPMHFAAIGSALAVLGLGTIWPALIALWELWMGDALKSIGMVIPVVSFVLILRVWKKLGWEAEGTWWGLVVILVTMAISWIREHVLLILVISPRWSTPLPPPSLMLLAYGSGVVLLLGGTRLFRAALFPILLLWFANPIPRAFSLAVDLPLQHASAHIARAFAMHLGHSLTPDHLRLMFTPDFGMFIAPGCDGIRGSITMGFIALIAGYVYRFRWYANALVVVGAVLLGYVFNLLRLCMLVLYYMVALHFPSLQDKAENADYVIGAVLFLIATLLLFAMINLLRDQAGSGTLDTGAVPASGKLQDHTPSSGYARLVAMGVIALLGCAGLAQASVASHASSAAATNAAVQRFPDHLGNYVLGRTWKETQVAGPVIYVWGQYALPGGRMPIAIGISPTLGLHDPLICHFIRGENPQWQGQLTVPIEGGDAVNLSSSFYNDGVTQFLEASTQCSGASCGEFATDRTHFGFIYTRIHGRSLLGEDSERPVPVLLRVETTDMTLSDDAARQRLTAELTDFLASVRLGDLALPYSR